MRFIALRLLRWRWPEGVRVFVGVVGRVGSADRQAWLAGYWGGRGKTKNYYLWPPPLIAGNISLIIVIAAGPTRTIKIAGKMNSTSGKISFTALQANFRELQTNELAQGLLSYVRSCFGVSVEMLGDMTSADRAKADAARWVFADQVLAARLEFLRTCLQKWLVPIVDPAVILHYDDIRPSDHARLLQAMTCQPNQAFTWNEVRIHLAGLEPLPELGNTRPLPMPGQTAPVQALDEQGQPAAEGEPTTDSTNA